MKLWILIPLSLLLGGTSGQELFTTKMTFVESTKAYFGDENSGTVAAFADYDGSGSPDVFVITADGHEIEIYSKYEDSNKWQKSTRDPVVRWPNDTIIGVTPADFTADQIMDLLIILVPDDGDDTTIKAYMQIGNEDLKFDEKILVSDQLLDQPISADYNYDMVADVFGATTDGKLVFWVFKAENSSFEETVIGEINPESSQHSFAFVDLDNDLTADLFIGYKTENDGYKYEAWRRDEYTWDSFKNITLHYPYVGIPTFVDVDANGSIDQVVPGCEDSDCQKSFVKYCSWGDETSTWTDLLTSETLDDWHFAPPKESTNTGKIQVGLKLREGDLNLDSYSDFICTMHLGADKTNKVVILLNNHGSSLSLDEQAVPALAENNSPFVAAFADISTTAHLDIIIGTEGEEMNNFHLMTNRFKPDANFIKVEVVQRTCNSKCTDKSHVSNQPGPVTKYKTTTPSSDKQYLTAALLSQSAYLALQLPYVIMGLGQNPNFVDDVTVSIPNACCGALPRRSSSWLSLIPNSQLVVYPEILDDPKSWQSSLIIHPSQSVLLTGVVLIGTGCFIGLIAGLLHLLERREDDKQKRQEAHKFHFDAM